ncbi:hypothetical protein AB0N38_30820 [Micromonospora aurantiaca]|nr:MULTISPECIES: hypothetical protein [Micromonospora]ADL48436.1 hypothetical protein Micau_4927 [Micromonospora aurantiaca ATCC 27029]ADU08882.1 hypothetical protein ML5_3368 [Micromonospora sp. L5]RNI03287.1 hypothetical protein EEZ25_10900 [Micromonospora aurantiaca]UFN93454.1 hypothetical protein LF814_26340 [Micromonospora aurantiaca]
MAKHRHMSDDAPRQATEDSGATYWSVTESHWPAGPAEVADLLAPPIVVGVARVVATSRMTPPGETGRPGRAPSRPGAAAHPAAAGATTVRLNAGSRPAPATRRPTPGRHRNSTA